LKNLAQNEWLADDATRRECVWKLGLLTGLKANEDGTFSPANFERALVLGRLVEKYRPARILEIGTGRGLGCLSMAESILALGYSAQIVTIDLLRRDQKQHWAIEIDGVRKVLQASRDEIWAQYIDRN